MFTKEILAPGIILYRTDKQEVKSILDLLEPAIGDKWQPSMTVNTDTYQDFLSSSRQCEDFAMSQDVQESSLKEVYIKTDNWIAPLISDFANEYSVERIDKGSYIYIRYKDTNKFDWHNDDGKRYPRTVSVSAYLNDDYEGGEIEFKHFNISHKPKAGDVVIFGSSFTYMHRVKPVINGTRYAVVNWYRYHGYPVEMP